METPGRLPDRNSAHGRGIGAGEVWQIGSGRKIGVEVVGQALGRNHDPAPQVKLLSRDAVQRRRAVPARIPVGAVWIQIPVIEAGEINLPRGAGGRAGRDPGGIELARLRRCRRAKLVQFRGNQRERIPIEAGQRSGGAGGHPDGNPPRRGRIPKLRQTPELQQAIAVSDPQGPPIHGKIHPSDRLKYRGRDRGEAFPGIRGEEVDPLGPCRDRENLSVAGPGYGRTGLRNLLNGDGVNLGSRVGRHHPEIASTRHRDEGALRGKSWLRTQLQRERLQHHSRPSNQPELQPRRIGDPGGIARTSKVDEPQRPGVPQPIHGLQRIHPQNSQPPKDSGDPDRSSVDRSNRVIEPGGIGEDLRGNAFPLQTPRCRIDVEATDITAAHHREAVSGRIPKNRVRPQLSQNRLPSSGFGVEHGDPILLRHGELGAIGLEVRAANGAAPFAVKPEQPGARRPDATQHADLPGAHHRQFLARPVKLDGAPPGRHPETLECGNMPEEGGAGFGGGKQQLPVR